MEVTKYSWTNFEFFFHRHARSFIAKVMAFYVIYSIFESCTLTKVSFQHIYFYWTPYPSHRNKECFAL
jgi:hypothetical protein